MRTTITLDDDVVALIEDERSRTGESFRHVVNRLLRRSAHRHITVKPPDLPVFPGQPLIDVTDTSAVLAQLDEDRRNRRGLP